MELKAALVVTVERVDLEDMVVTVPTVDMGFTNTRRLLSSMNRKKGKDGRLVRLIGFYKSRIIIPVIKYHRLDFIFFIPLL